jgi:hypothetical protein
MEYRGTEYAVCAGRGAVHSIINGGRAASGDPPFCMTRTSSNATSGDMISASKNQPTPSRPLAFAATPTTMANRHHKIAISIAPPLHLMPIVSQPCRDRNQISWRNPPQPQMQLIQLLTSIFSFWIIGILTIVDSATLDPAVSPISNAITSIHIKRIVPHWFSI